MKLFFSNRNVGLKWLVGQCLNTIIIVAFGWLTMKTSCNLIFQYIGGTTSSIMQTMFNKTMTLPTSTLCLPLLCANNLFKCRPSSDKLLANLTSVMDKRSRVSLQEEIKIGFESNLLSNKSNLLYGKKRWPKWLLNSALQYLACMTHYEFFEAYIVTSTLTRIGTYQTNPCRSNESTDLVLIDAMSILSEKLKVINVTTYEFRQRVGSEVAIAYSLMVAQESYQTSVDMDIDFSETTYVSLSQICYRMRFDQHSLTKETRDELYVQATVPFDAAEKNFDEQNLDNFNSFNILILDYYIYIDFSGRAVVSADDVDYKLVFSLLFGSHNFLLVSLTAEYRAMSNVNGSIQCSDSQTLDDCQAECKANYISRNCNCSSSYSNSMINPKIEDYEECRLENYLLCLKRLEQYDRACEANCPSSCVTFDFDLVPLTRYEHYGQPGDTVLVEIAMVTFDYPIYEESYLWTTESFLGALGGALGIWLGIDFLNTLQFLTMLISSLKQFMVKGSSPSKKENDVRPCASSHVGVEKTVVSSQCEIQTKNERPLHNGSTHKTVKFVKTLLSKYEIQIDSKSLTWQKISKSLIWITIVLLFAMIAVNYSISFYESYKSQSTISFYDTIFNTTMTLPNATLCLPLFPRELDELRHRNESIDNATSELYENETIVYFNQNNMSKQFFLDGLWPNSLLHVTHTYLALLTFCEAFVGREAINCSKEELTPPWQNNDYDQPQARRIFETNLRKLNVSTDEIRQKLGSEVKDLYSLTAIYRSSAISASYSDSEKNVGLVGQTLFVDNLQICYELILSGKILSLESEIRINASEYSLPHPLLFDENRGYMTVDLRKRYWSEDSSTLWTYSERYGAIARGQFPHNNRVTVETSAVFMELQQVKGEIRCSSEFSLDDCEAQCRISFIASLCNCSANAWPHLTSQMTRKVCDLEQYSSCLLFNGTTDSDCKSNCLDLCEKTTYKIVVVSEDKVGLSDAYQYPMFSLTIQNFDWMVFQETLEYPTFNSFLGAFGGIIALFLGLDFLKILNSIYSFCRKLFATYRELKLIMLDNENMVIEIQPECPINQGTTRLSFTKPLRWLASNFFEIITTAVFVFLTAQMGSDFIQQIKDNKPTPDMTMNFKQNISLQISTVCLELELWELEEFWTNKTNDYYTIPNTTLITMEYYFNNSNFTKEVFLNGTWPGNLLFVVHTYLVFMTDTETKTTNNMNCSEINSNVYVGEMNYLQPAQLLLEDRMLFLNITTDELRQKFGSEVAEHFFALNVTQTGTGTEEDVPINLDRTNSVSSFGICFQFRFDQYPFCEQRKQIITITTKRDIQREELSIAERNIEVDLTGGNKTGIEPNVAQHKTIWTLDRTFIKAYISVNTVLQALTSLNDGITRCSNYLTLENCIARCRFNLIRRLCSCSATSWSWLTPLPSVERECRMRDYISCLELNITADETCANSCVGLCERWNYNLYSYKENGFGNSFDNTGTLIQIQVTKFDYPKIVEQQTWTFDTIIASFGNVLGFYLGLYFWIMIQFSVAKAVSLVTFLKLWLKGNGSVHILQA